ncbi:hypothetical protein FRC14_000290 [Serendipita sp. 396]|nr:hypothetical protein FRC14_000290 [Serendipita sp. 396]KAG8828480.1 hypothetical protein FRC19_003819 [Serendipita sp. 401]KAG9058123.1 hypothetical protein FS842_001307 [Serendipita sp. 407]
MNPVNRNFTRSPSPSFQSVDDEDEPTENTRLLADHDRIHETSEEIEDLPSEPDHNGQEPNPARNRLNPRHEEFNYYNNEPHPDINEPNHDIDEPNHDNDHLQDMRSERSVPFWRWDNDKIKSRSFSIIPIFLLIPSLVFFIMTLSMRPPPSSLEVIENLTRRVSELSSSLTTCSANTTRLAIELHDEQKRSGVCREHEKRLAQRIDTVQRMLEVCQIEGSVLKKNLETTQKKLSVCDAERDDLKRQIKDAAYIQFLDMVGKLGTGGASWVCSDKIESWSYGFTATEAPHSTIKIQTWTSELHDAEHSAKPLVFPPDPFTAIPDPTPPQPSPSFQSRIQKRWSSPSYSRPPQMGEEPSPRIIGYSVVSENTSGNNGWWRINQLPSFGDGEAKLEFFAQAGQWRGNKARYQVSVFWI